MSRVLVLSGLAAWVGAALVLSQLRWFSRPPLANRLRPYAPGGMGRPTRAGLLSVESFREAVGPLARLVGERLARVLGVSEDLETRLRRVHSPLDVTGFRVRQLGYSVGAFGLGALFAVTVGPAPVVALLLVLGTPLLAFLVLEQRLAAASAAWQERTFLELPVVTEQLALLVSSGYSLTAALDRVSRRGQGACALDLRRVVGRIRQGLTEAEALREWAALVRVDALDHLVPILALNRDTTDLGRLLSEEARAVRREVHRRLIETAERRSQQVWIPVTVATLLPGAIFLAVPFIEALRLFGA